MQRIEQLPVEQRQDSMKCRALGMGHFNDDLAIQRKYDKLKAKTLKIMPLILTSEDPELVKRLTNSLRRYLPKAFFSTTKRYMKEISTPAGNVTTRRPQRVDSLNTDGRYMKERSSHAENVTTRLQQSV